MANVVSYVVNSGYLKIGGKWYAKGGVIRGLAKPIAQELIKAGRISALEGQLVKIEPPPKDPDPPKPSKPPKK